MLTDYSEDALVEQPAIALLAELGWETQNCYHETADTDLPTQLGAAPTLISDSHRPREEERRRPRPVKWCTNSRLLHPLVRQFNSP
jgi:hypothetical protein